MKKVATYHNTYPSLFADGILDEATVETQREFYETNKNKFAVDLETYTHVVDLGETTVRGIVVPGESPESIVIGGEYGNAITLPAYVRAMGIRAVVNAEASLVLLPNNTLGEDNLGFTHAERSRVAAGDDSPYTTRYRKLLETTPAQDDHPVHIVGMSLGASTGAALATSQHVNARSLTLVEAPHLSGNVVGIMSKFVTSGGQLSQHVEMSKQDIEDFDALDNGDALGMIKFGIGSLSKDNLASLKFIQNRNIDKDITDAYSTHHKIGIVNAYGTEAHVSPVATNRQIADNHKSDRFNSFEITGADHSITNAHAVVAALAKRAKELSRQ